MKPRKRRPSELHERPDGMNKPPDWSQAIGMFAGDEFMRKIFEEGRKIREAEREKARGRNKKK
jgi:hypothetical protein